MFYIKKLENFGNINFDEVIRSENEDKAKVLDELIDEISRVRNLLVGDKNGPLREDYLNKILDFL